MSEERRLHLERANTALRVTLTNVLHLVEQLPRNRGAPISEATSNQYAVVAKEIRRTLSETAP